MNARQAAKAMGWFSLGLGATQVLAPRWLGRQTGVGEHPRLMRAFGVREIASGVGVLAQRRPEAGMWARVAGDAVDLAALGSQLRGNRQGGRVAAAIGMVAAAGVADVVTARALRRH